MPNVLQLAEDKVLVEQLRLMYKGLTFSILPMFPAIFLLVWTLSNAHNRTQLLVWAVLLSIVNVGFILHARYQLAHGFFVENPRRLTIALLFSFTMGGAAWGLLGYLGIGNTSPVGTIVVISVLAGILGGAVGLLSAVVPLFVAFSIPLVGLTAARLLQLEDPAYKAFGLISLMYLGVLNVQCYNAGLAIRAAIDLRFENLILLKSTESAQMQAELANLAKSKFLAAASHDLRQPVYAQGLFLEVLSYTELTQHQTEILASARSASAASAEMLNTLLDFSRIEAGAVVPVLAPFSLQILFDKIENDLAPVAQAKGLVYRSRETTATIKSDSSLVELVLRNLVSNAIRYTEQGGLLVACRQQGGCVVVEVWDTGVGIAIENQIEIFREFHQLGNPERDRRKGLGLGLAIADGSAKVLGQTLTVRSKPGSGSVFKLTLPLCANTEVAKLDAGLLPGKTSLQGVSALVIDDDVAVLMGMAQLLRSWGCKVDTAESIEQALQMAELRTPDVVLTDYRLRGHRTGLEAVSALRKQLGNDLLPALMITGDTAPDRLRETLSSGLPLLHKPVSPVQLLRTLTGLLPQR